MIFQSGLGIDFRQNSVSVALLQGSLTGIRAGASLYHVFSKDINRPERISQSVDLIRNFIERHKLEKPDVYLSIPRELMIVREVDFPSAVKDNLAGTITYELEKYIPIPASEIYLDHLVLSENKVEGQIKVLLVAARKTDIDEYLQLFEQTGFRLSGIDFRPTALTDFIIGFSDRPRSGFHVLLFDDGDGIDFILNKGNALCFSRYFRGKEIGTNGLSEAISETKKRFEIEASPLPVGYVKETNLSQPVELLLNEPDVELYSVNPIGEEAVPPAVVSAQALAMRAVRQSGNGLNLLPLQYRKRPSRIPQYLFFALSLLLLISILTLGGSIVIRRQLDNKRLDEELANMRPEVERVKRIELEIDDLSRTIKQVNLLQKQRVSTIDVLKELTLVIPRDAWITSLNYKKSDVQIEVVAEKAMELIPLIESSPFFKEAKPLSGLSRDQKSGKERFRIGFKVDHD